MTRGNGGTHYRPGPVFRCPDCGSHRVRATSREGMRTSRYKVAYPVECLQCDRFWMSKHREARRLAEGLPR